MAQNSIKTCSILPYFSFIMYMYMHVGYFYNMHVFCALMLKYGLLTKGEVKMAGY